jgi:small nuclear ribonucleoprotein (snRNP)-like protein
MNLVLDDAEEVDAAPATGARRGGAAAPARRALGRILLKGDSVSLISAAPGSAAPAGAT